MVGDIGDAAIEFERDLTQLAGKECWAFYAGRASGSVIDLHFGAKLPRRQPLQNVNLSDTERNYDGEFSLYVECAWRLDSIDQVIAGWTQWSDSIDNMFEGLRLVKGRRVEQVDIKRPAWDLTLRFDNNLALSVFADQDSILDPVDNYCLFTGSKIYTVASRSQIQVEQRRRR
jgi:hypothetical protein